MAESDMVGAQADAAKIKAQYRDSSRLARRANIHKYGRSPVGWFNTVARSARLPANAEVLEVGCGPGWLWAQAADDFLPGLALTLTDLSEGMVEEALARVAPIGRYRAVAGRAADVMALPFADASFDAVLACHMLYHVPAPERALDEIVRVLRPGGIVVVTTNGADNMAEMYALGAAAFGGPASDPSGLSFGIEAAEAMLRARFADLDIAISRDELHVTDGEDIIAVLTSYPPGDSATEAQIEALREMIAERMSGGVFKMGKRQGLVRGRRAG
jgi:SAM-dependent methyltransferase